jgi:hypothetical protein
MFLIKVSRNGQNHPKEQLQEPGLVDFGLQFANPNIWNVIIEGVKGIALCWFKSYLSNSFSLLKFPG